MRPAIDELLDYDENIERTRENEYGETEYRYQDEWYEEDELIDLLMEEDRQEIDVAGGLLDDLLQDVLHFPIHYYQDDEDYDY